MGIAADCARIKTSAEAKSIWSEFSRRFGPIPYPAAFRVCIGNKYFHELSGGAHMASALDRKRSRVLLRKRDNETMRHELAHLYLDLAWKILPYKTSEALATAMQTEPNCAKLKSDSVAVSLHERWRNRKNLSACDMEALMRDVLGASRGKRENLPLN